MQKKIIIWIITVVVLMLPSFVHAKDIYDVVLFWGQSNMVGTCGGNINTVDDLTDEDDVDANLTRLGVNEFSKQTGISKEIVDRYEKISHVAVPFVKNTVFDYNYESDSLIELTSDTNYIGEILYPYVSGNNVTFKRKNPADGTAYSFRSSRGTNMIFWFGKQWYELTGHKLIIVMAAKGAQPISVFLPHNAEYTSNGVTVKNTDASYLYEGMIAKYKAAINYLNKNNMEIGHKFNVIMQGEADVMLRTQASEWYDRYLTIHNLLKNNLGMEFSVISKTSVTIGNYHYNLAKVISDAQDKAINSNNDIILGSAYSWNRFVPTESTYNGNFLGKTTNYSDALKQSKLSMCLTDYTINHAGETINGILVKENRIHFNSAALSQIGLESANNSYNYILKKELEEKYSGMLLKSLKINNTNIILKGDTYEYILEADKENISIDASLIDNNLKFVSGYEPRTVTLKDSKENIILRVERPDGITKDYTIKITREDENKSNEQITNEDKKDDSNTLVKVPNTNSHRNPIYVFIAMLLIFLGIGLIMFVKNKIANNKV